MLRATPPSATAISEMDDVAMLERALQLAKDRQAKAKAEATAPPQPAPVAASAAQPKKGFTIKTFNAISPVGLERFPKGEPACGS